MMTPKMRSELCAQILSLSRQLMLSTQLSETCMQTGTQKQLEFIRDLFLEELSIRAENKTNRLLKKASFPAYKTLDHYETGRITFPAGITIDQIRDCSFLEENLDMIFFGPVGTGKTHLAIAAGVAACRMGFQVRFHTVASLIRLLSESSRTGRLEKLLAELRKLDLLILDEWGYVPVDRDGAHLLFQVISESYENKSIIITTNLEFSKWGTVFDDEQMAAAMIDRLAHHGHLLVFEGTSYRMEHALMRQTAAAG